MLYTYMYILCIFATIRGGTSHRRGGSDMHNVKILVISSFIWIIFPDLK